MKKRMPRYEDCFKKSEFSCQELALLMAATSPEWEFGQEILRAYEDGEAYDEFCMKYQSVKEHWAFWEEFCRADDLIFRSLHTGMLRSCKGSKPGQIPRDAAIQFVLQCEGEYGAFIEAAKLAYLDNGTVKQRLDGDLSNIDASSSKNWKKLIQDEAEKRWDRLLKSGGQPNKNNLKNDLANWCINNNVKTERGGPPSVAYIARHVLQKWKPPSS